MKGPSIRRAAVVLAMAASAALSACVVQDQRPTERVVVEKATTEIPQEQLLDVGIMLFDPNIPDDPEEREKQRIFPDVREAEARYMPVVLRDTLEGTGYWGQVRVLPRNVTSMDVYIRGTIIKSTGEELEFDLDVTDVTGRRWFSKTYKGKADTRAYKDIPSRPIDPFEALYHTVANDLIAARRIETYEWTALASPHYEDRFDKKRRASRATDAAALRLRAAPPPDPARARAPQATSAGTTGG